MESAAPESKRPRLSASSSWAHGTSPHGVSLPHPTPHHPAPAPYQTQHHYSRPPDTPTTAGQHPLDERRHHELESYPPMQDPHRQPPPSPAHPHYPPYPGREPIVKRDPGEDTPLPHLRRPNSTGMVENGLPQGSHGPPHSSQQQHSEDPRRHMSFDNGPAMAQSPTVYRPPQSYPPPTPVSHHSQYDSGHLYGPPSAGPHMYPPLEIQSSSAKRKPQRASQACDSCRQLKAKCDETKPCKNCKEKGVKCIYREPTVKQPDKATTDILDMLSTMRDEMSSGLRRMDQRLTSLEATMRHDAPSGHMKVEDSVEEDEQADSVGSPSMSKTAHEEPCGSPNEAVLEPPLSLPEAHATIQRMNDDDMEDEPGPMKVGKPAMPMNHTTLAGLLLKWHPIEQMVRHHLEAEKIHHVEEFPIRQELQRGMLRVFGQGEGFDQEIRSNEYSSHMDQVMTDIHDDYSDVASPTPAKEVWGQVGGLEAPPGVQFKGAVIDADGNPDFDPNKVWRYVQSFKDNILNMHPIIIPKELDAMVRIFLDSLPPSTSKQSTKASATSRFVNQPTSSGPPYVETGAKRKRSPAGDETTPSVQFQKPGRPYRSVHSALILLVFALGKICLHKDRIPDLVHDAPDPPTFNSPSVRNGIPPSPLQGSPPGLVSGSQSSGLPSPKENERSLPSRRPSIQGAGVSGKGAPMKRNIDVIPGLEYFALATDIIGSHLGGHNLKHVYVFILAGLYHGQLGRIIESWSYINVASTRLHAILRPSLNRFSNMKNNNQSAGEARRDNQLAFAFWTCLQLESDILAELPLAQSPILQHEDQMPYPSAVFAHSQGYPDHVIQGYLAQLHLRKKLNQVHNLLYDPAKNNQPRDMINDPQIEMGISAIQGELKDSRAIWVPPLYTWKDEDPPADNILHARLRAKYWGSQVIIYRVYLRSILEGSTPTYASQPPPPDEWASIGLDVDRRDVPSNIDPRTLNFARLGIHALIESTRAFHGLDRQQRLIVTNVFGTAHAQWGNLLTLAACHRNPVVSMFVPKDLLGDLIHRTIEFFEMIVQPTSALLVDMNILKGLAQDLGLTYYDPVDAQGSSSFSSMTSNGPVVPPLQTTGEGYIHSPQGVYIQSPFGPPPPHPLS